tara:strand:- start:2151 stop:3608 length:1458 start_codon:yes stop_codon:yes gene_type:complete
MAITSDTNRVAVGIIEEVTFGTTPATPAIDGLRITGTPSLGYVPQTVTSDEIRADRQVTDLILVGAEAGGDVGMEVSFNALDSVFEGAMGSDWVTKAYRETVSEISAVNVGVDYTVTAVAGDNFAVGMLVLATGFVEAANNATFRAETGTTSTSVQYASAAAETPGATAKLRGIGMEGIAGDLTTTAGGTNSIDSTALVFTDMNMAIGEWLKVGGNVTGEQSETAENNDWVRISAISGTSLTLDRVPVGWASDTNAAKTLQLFMGESLVNGTVSKSYSIERQFQDHSPVTYELFTGMRVGTLTVEFEAQAIMTSTVNFMGLDSTMSTTRFSGATDVAAPTNEVLNTSSDVGRIGEAGAAVGDPNYVIDGSIQVDNNLRRQNAVGSLGSVGIGQGEFNVTGSLNTYFGSSALAAKVISNAASSFDLRVSDDANQALVIDLPSLKFSAGSPNVPGKNDDVVVPLEFQAYRDATLGYTMLLQRFYATA